MLELNGGCTLVKGMALSCITKKEALILKGTMKKTNQGTVVEREGGLEDKKGRGQWGEKSVHEKRCRPRPVLLSTSYSKYRIAVSGYFTLPT